MPLDAKYKTKGKNKTKTNRRIKNNLQKNSFKDSKETRGRHPNRIAGQECTPTFDDRRQVIQIAILAFVRFMTCINAYRVIS